MRINVFISSTGYCSRREADRLIEAGRVTLNGKVVPLGTDVGKDDVVLVDGKPVKARPQTVYLAFHKPEGIESTTDLTKPDNIIDFIGYPERIFPIGRLDKDSSGLILLTNDGQIVNQILRSEFDHEKEYEVEVDRPVTPAFLSAMAAGVKIYNPVRHEYTVTKPCRTKKIGDRSFSVVLTQGLNLQIRRMARELGYQVERLRRVRIMNIRLGTLPPGEYRILDGDELSKLLSSVR
ncbi:MAG TPA: pseudouridine synthase [Candidatus Izemoplasmatales bacterium]|nr:pseudouridine synthase [Bacillota bacterium]HRY78346.1 pseudouridine synthase [Candidatus Izemoplasmatales bacterium]